MWHLLSVARPERSEGRDFLEVANLMRRRSLPGLPEPRPASVLKYSNPEPDGFLFSAIGLPRRTTLSRYTKGLAKVVCLEKLARQALVRIDRETTSPIPCRPRAPEKRFGD